MSTRSRIGLEMPDGKIKSIYCHFDGYKEGVGATLKKHYTDPKKIEQLLELGDISILGVEYDEQLSKISWHRYDKDLSEADKKLLEKLDEGDYTVAYKDRGETGVEARIDENRSEFVDKAGSCGEVYTYLFTEDYTGVYKWHCMETPCFCPL